MKQKLMLTISLLLSMYTFAQEKNNINFYGFIRNSLYTDTYRGLESSADQFYLFPLYTDQDDNGDDYNASFKSNLTAIASRLGITYNGPEVFGAQTSAKMEFDFAGITGSHPVLFRIRQAFVKLNWEKSSLILGQTWHPFWNDGCFTHVGSLNTGAPFVAFNRSPQIRFDYHMGNFTLLGAAVYENQYTSKGFYTVNNDIDKTKPLRYSGTPELLAMAKIKAGAFTAGVGAEYKTILPIDRTTANDGKTYKTDITNKSYGLSAFANYKKDKLYVLINSIVGQNLTHLTQVGGYGVKSVDPNTGEFEYTNYNTYTASANITYGKKWQGGLFLGIGGNLGTSEALADMGGGTAQTAGIFPKIQNLNRIAPSLTLNVKNMRFTAEYEMTSANYGTGNINLSDGLYTTTHTATNHRMLFMMMYIF